MVILPVFIPHSTRCYIGTIAMVSTGELTEDNDMKLRDAVLHFFSAPMLL